MSFQAMTWALGQDVGGPGPKVVLLLLANYADENGSCFPGHARIAAETCQSERTVRTQLDRLREQDLIRWESRGRAGTGGRSSNRYFLNLGNAADFAGNPKPANPEGQTGKSEEANRQLVAGEPPVLEPSDLEPPEGISAGDDGLFSLGAPAQPDPEPGDGPTFDEFWSVYPLKKAKQTALKAWSKALLTVSKPKRVALASVILEGAKRYAKERAGQDPKFTRHPSTWLNGGCWEDEPAPAGGNPGGGYRQYRNADYYPDAKPWFDPDALDD